MDTHVKMLPNRVGVDPAMDKIGESRHRRKCEQIDPDCMRNGNLGQHGSNGLETQNGYANTDSVRFLLPQTCHFPSSSIEHRCSNKDNCCVSSSYIYKNSSSVKNSNSFVHKRSNSRPHRCVNKPVCRKSTFCCLNGAISNNKFSHHKSNVLLNYARHILTITICILLSLTPTVEGVTWKTKPSDTSLSLGGRATLTCAINDRVANNFIWSHVGQGTLFVNEIRFNNNTTGRYNVRETSFGYDLELLNGVKQDDGEYKCEISNFESATAEVTVLVPPQQPTEVSLNKTISSIQEGDFIQLSCASPEGNPPPSITWYRAGVSLNGGTVTPPDDKFGTTIGYYVLETSFDDHSKTFRCDIENEANTGNPVTRSIVLNVQYAPKLTIGPYNPYIIKRGSGVTLTCEVDANPAVPQEQIKWFHQGSLIDTGREYVITDAQNSQTLSCQATNNIGARSTDIVTDVQYGPMVTIRHNSGFLRDDEIIINENLRLNLTCLVDANPPVKNSDIMWENADGEYIHTGVSYVFDAVSREDTGSYSCRAQNTITPSGGAPEVLTGSNAVTVTVEYVPGEATIQIPANVTVGNEATLRCTLSDPGFPAATFKWTKSGSETVLGTTNTYRIASTRLSDNGDYFCTPTNKVGDGKPDRKTLNVNEIPRWNGPYLPPTLIKLLTDRQVTVECNVRGRPQPQVKWYKDSIEIIPSNGMFSISLFHNPVDVHSFAVRSILKWEGLNRSPNTDSLHVNDTGSYTCHAFNEASPTGLESDMQFSVHYKPMVDTAIDRVAIDMNQSASLVCAAHALPVPSFAWYNGSALLQTGGRIHISNYQTQGEYNRHSVLNISDIKRQDFANYTCRVSNELGTTSHTIHLSVRNVPEAPNNLKALTKTWESVELTWNEGFDGGYPQQFVIHFSSPDHPQGLREGVTNLPYNVTDLFPNQHYTFRVFATNFLGPGDYSNTISTTTREFTMDAPTEVEYNSKTRELKFTSPSTDYCARVDLSEDKESWWLYEKCAPTEGGSIKISEEESFKELRVALCLTRRNEVCGEPEEAVFEPTEDLPSSTIIIVAVICGAIVLALTIVLIVLCWRRYKSKKQYEEQQKMQPVQNPQQQLNGGLKPAIKGVDNPAVERPDNVDFDDPTRGGVFSTDLSSYPPNYGYNHHRPQQHHHHSNNGGHHHGNGYLGNGSAPPSYSSEWDKSQGQESPYLPMHKPRNDKPYTDDQFTPHETSKEGSSDSGVSTPDPYKPKKVIYEVIV